MWDFLRRYTSYVFLCVCFLLLMGCQSSTLPGKNIGGKEQGNISLDFSADEKAYIMAVFQGTISASFDALAPHTHEVIAVLRDGGRRIARGYGGGSGSRANIEQARNQALLAAGRAFTDLSDLDSHVFVLGSWQAKDSGYIHGLHALKIIHNEQEVVYRPSYAIETNRSYTKVIERMCASIDITPEYCGDTGGIGVMYAAVVHLAATGTFADYREYYRGKILEHQQEITLDYLDTIIDPASDRLIENLSGDFTYVYNPSSGIYSENNNMIRQLMASRWLAEQATKNGSLIEKHRENLTYIFDNWYEEEGDTGYVWYKNKSKLGAIAMLMRTLVASPVSEEYIDEITKLTNTLLVLQDEEGAFEPRYIPPDYAYDADYLLTFYSGEALLAMLELYKKFANEDVLDAAIRGQDFYLQRYVEEIDQWYYPAYVPRHTMSLYHLYTITKNERYAEAIFTLNDKLIAEMLHTQKDNPQDILGRFYNPIFDHYGTPHSASDGVYLEGLVYAYMLADEQGDEVRTKKYRDALTLAVHNIAQLQYRTGDMYFMQYPERVEGAVRFRADDNRIRVDTTQHMLDGLSVLKRYILLVE